VVVVTGGASGIGRAAVLLLADRGACVGVLDVDEEWRVKAGEAAHEVPAAAGAQPTPAG
jgi:NAD(P)-dependent dehydrogenase (short-subunit alcohol dehydrogenase family)